MELSPARLHNVHFYAITHLELLILGAPDEVAADLLQGLDVPRGQSDPDPVHGLLLLHSLAILENEQCIGEQKLLKTFNLWFDLIQVALKLNQMTIVRCSCRQAYYQTPSMVVGMVLANPAISLAHWCY